MEDLPKEIHNNVISLLGIAELFILCFVSKKYEPLFKKYIKKIEYYDIHRTIFCLLSSVSVMKWYYSLYRHIFSNWHMSNATNNSGNLELYNWLIENNASNYVNISICAKMGYYNLLHKLDIKCYTSKWGYSRSLENKIGNYELLYWMMDNKIKIPYSTVTLSILVGDGLKNVNCDRLEELYYKEFDVYMDLEKTKPEKIRGFPGDPRYIPMILSQEKLVNNVIKILKNKVDKNDITIAATKANNINALNFLKTVDIFSADHAFDYGLICNNMEIIEWLIEEIGYQNRTIKINKRKIFGYKLLKYLFNQGFILTDDYYYFVLGDLKAMKFLFKHGIPFPYYYINYLVLDDNIENLKWSIQNGCEIFFNTISYCRNLDMLNYIRSLNLESLIVEYHSDIDLKMIKYFVSKKYMFCDNFVTGARCYGTSDIKKWVTKYHVSIIFLTMEYSYES
jgi:hypothetical protein